MTIMQLARLSGRGGRLGGVGTLPHGLRLRPVERWRRAAAVRLRRSASLRAPADKNVGFGPTKRALSRIAKEGRKYGVFLGHGARTASGGDRRQPSSSQCSTLFVMRLSNEGDQKPDPLRRCRTPPPIYCPFIPSPGTREVFTFGSGVALPTRMRFQELSADKRPNSEASGNTRSDAGTNTNRDLLTTVIERWRSASMSHRMSDDIYDDAGSPFDSPALQPTCKRKPSRRSIHRFSRRVLRCMHRKPKPRRRRDRKACARAC